MHLHMHAQFIGAVHRPGVFLHFFCTLYDKHKQKITEIIQIPTRATSLGNVQNAFNSSIRGQNYN